MQLIQSGVPFTFSYGAYDQADGLNIAASIFDLTSGTPVFVALVPMVDQGFGVYFGSYNGNSAKTYLVAIFAYTTNSYTVVDNTRPPSAECYQGIQRSLTTFPFNYAAYDLDSSLFVAGKIYNEQGGFIETIPMVNVINGVYYGAYNNVSLGTSYFVISQVYTDDTYTTVVSSRIPGNDTFQGPIFSELQSVQSGPNIIGVIDGSNNPNYPYPPTPQLTLYQGETRSFLIRVVGPNYLPFDSSNLVDIQVEFLGYNGVAQIISMSSFYGGVQPVSLEQSLFLCNLSTPLTQQFQTGEQLNFTAYLYFGNFAAGVYTGNFGTVNFSSTTPGSFGNVTLSFDGLSTLQTILEEFADANPNAPTIVFLPTGVIQATANLLFNYNAVDGQTLTITGPMSLNDVYTFRNTPVNPKDVLIGPTPAGTVLNLITSLNIYGGNNYTAVPGPNGNQIILYAGSNYPAVNGNLLSAVASSPLTITVTNFAGGTTAITDSLVLPMGTVSLIGGTDNNRIADFPRSLNARFPSV